MRSSSLLAMWTIGVTVADIVTPISCADADLLLLQKASELRCGRSGTITSCGDRAQADDY
jgi:hypothetical protein